MPTVKRIVCLANSRKLTGRCVAGKELLEGDRPGGWVRPVSNRETEEVSEYERQYADGSDPRVLDIIDIPLIGARPKNYQRENWLLDPNMYWGKVDRASVESLNRITDAVAPLWVNGSNTYNGLNDRMPVVTASALQDSLRLIKVDTITILVHQPGLAFDNPKRRVQGRFSYAGTDYRLRVTDPIIERGFLQKENGEYPLGEMFLTVSLGEPYNGYCYKLIAAVIAPTAGAAA